MKLEKITEWMPLILLIIIGVAAYYDDNPVTWLILSYLAIDRLERARVITENK
jgi:hypothetical protein